MDLQRVELTAVRLQPVPMSRLAGALPPGRIEELEAKAAKVATALGGRQLLHVNSTATGGGVAEMLGTLLGYVRGAGIDVRWAVIGGTPEFFTLTKRIHHGVYGSPGDGGPLGEDERALYEKVLAANATGLRATVRPDDLVILHDPQTAGLVPHLKRIGARVVWRSHIGTDTATGWSARAWDFLRPYLEDVDGLVVSKRAFAPYWVDPAQVFEIAPSIDPLSPKNTDLDPDTALAVLQYTGLLDGKPSDGGLSFLRHDGSPGRVEHRADILQAGPPPPGDVDLVVQISRWDLQKDMEGVMAGFAEHVAPTTDAHLLLVGPNVTGVADDPEGPAVLQACMDSWRRLPHDTRTRVHLACLPTTDADENAVLVNALQRSAAVVVQKSIAEGFGLTVAEAMWKGRPVVASRVGGIDLQVEHGRTGLLVDDPHDLAGFGAAVRRLLNDPAEADAMGEAGRERVRELFLPDRHLDQYGDLVAAMLEPARTPRPRRRVRGTLPENTG